MKISPARLAAFDILLRIETERAFSSVLLPLYEEKLSSNDRGLCHELVLGVLRRQIYLDKAIEKYSGDRKLDTAVRIALRLGAYQLLFLDKIPAYSAINESVNLVQRAKKTSAKGLVNVVLRKISDGIVDLDHADDVERIAIETSHPRWLIDEWIADFGIEDAEQIAVSNNSVPRTAFRITRKGRLNGFSSEAARSEHVEGCYFASSIDADLRGAADAGEIYIQDEASQLVAQMVARAAGDKFIDVCAAPGGKTSRVAAEAETIDKMLFVAGDLHASRVRILRSTCVKQGAGFVNVVQYDAANALPFADKSFDLVLVDAPCSGTGTIRHNPEIRYFLAAGDIVELSRKQLAILRNASKLVRPGGRLFYSTCSMQVAENEGVCSAFMETEPEFRQVPPRVPVKFLTDTGVARTFPHRDEMDGFFIAEFERRLEKC